MNNFQFNLTRDPFIPIDDGTGRRWVTLFDFLSMDIPARIDHPISALNSPILLLVSAMTQYLQDATGGVTAKQIQDALKKGAGFNYSFLPDPDSAGFDLFGGNAFMQIPQAWVEAVQRSVEKNPASKFGASRPDGLFKPFRTDGGKGLRLPSRQFDGVCPACAAVGIFFKNSFTAPMAQYWGRSAVAGLLVALHLAVKDRAYDLPLSVGLNLVPSWKLEEYPWIKGAKSLLDAICFPSDQKLSRSASLLPLVRAQRLVAPQTTGACDCCGRTEQPLITQYHEIGEKTLYAALDVTSQEKIASAVAVAGVSTEAVEDSADGKKGGAYGGPKLLAMMYQDFESRRHPNVPYKVGKEGKLVPVIHSEGVGEATQQSPAWTRFSDILAPDSMITMEPMAGVTMAQKNAHAVASKRLAMALYTIVPESGTNPNPRYLLDERYSLLHADDTVHGIKEVRQTVGLLTQESRALITILATSAAFLFKDVEISNDGFSLKAKSANGMNPMGSAKRLASLRSGATRIWDEAFALVNEAAEEIRKDPDEEIIAQLRRRHVAHLESVAWEIWKQVEKTEFPSGGDTRDFYLQSRATKDFRKQMAARRKDASQQPSKAKEA